MNFVEKLNENQMKDWEKQMEIFKRGVSEIVPLQELGEKVAKSILTGIPLKVKLGLDPSAPDVHLGHVVVLNKLKQFQECGHIIQLVIGDFTGKIGDPTDKNATRKQLTNEEVKKNAQTYFEQFGKIIDMDKVQLHYNSDWLGSLSFDEVLNLASQITVARLMERKDFANRINENKPVSLHEFFYPIMQGFDSVHLKSDIEIGGTDQHFNLLMGRHFQERNGQEKQVSIMMPLLEGLDGVEKMSKSKNNYIGIDDSPKEIFGKTMSMPDDLIVKFFDLVTNLEKNEVEKIKSELANGISHPRDVKMKLAKMLVAQFHNEDKSLEAEQEFIDLFQKKKVPEKMKEVVFKKNEIRLVVDLLVRLEMLSSKTEAKKMIRNNGVSIDGKKIKDEFEIVKQEGKQIIQVGKRKFIRLVIE